MGKGSSPTQHTDSTTTPDKRISDWSDQIMGGVMDHAMPGGKLAKYPEFNYARDYKLGTEQVAGLNNFHQGALDTVSNAAGYEGNFNNAQKLAGPGNYASNYIDPTRIGAFSTSEISRFQNPYDDMVVGQGLQDLGRSYDKARVDADATAASSGAFGGSRQALLDGEVARNFADSASRFIGQQRQAGYDKAIGARQAEIGNTLAITRADNDENQRSIDNQLKLAREGTSLAGQQAGLQQGAGDLVRGVDQQTRDAARAEVQRQFEFPINLGSKLQGLNVGSVGAYPLKTAGTTKQSGGSSKGSQILGSAIGSMGSMFSDEDIKTEVHDDVDGEQVLGAFRATPVKSWEYDEQAQAEHGLDGERHVGPMAADLAEAFGEEAPEAAPGIDGIDVVSMLGKLTAAIKALDSRTRDLAPAGAEPEAA